MNRLKMFLLWRVSVCFVACSFFCVSLVSAHPRQYLLADFFSVGRQKTEKAIFLPPLLVGGKTNIFIKRPQLGKLAHLLGALSIKKQVERLQKKQQAGHQLILRAPRNPLEPGGSIGEQVEIEKINGLELPKDLFISGTVTAPEFIGHLTGDVTGAASLNVLKAGDSMTGDLVMTHQTGVQLQGSDGGHTVRLQAPVAVSTGYDLTFPDTAGPAHAVLINQGSGVLAWHDISPSSRYIQDGGNAVGEEISIGTQDNFPLAFITNSVERMRVEASGSISTAGTFTTGGRLSILSGGAYVSGDVEIDGDLDFDGDMDVEGALTVGDGLTVSSGGAYVSGDVAVDGSVTSTSGFVGDVTGAASLNVLKAGDTMTGTLALAGGTELRLHESGGAAVDYVSIKAPADVVASYPLILPVAQGTVDYVLGLQDSGTGQLKWVDIGEDSVIIQSGGNSLGEPMTLGSNDSELVSLLAGGVSQLEVAPSGITTINGSLVSKKKLTIESQGAEITGPVALIDNSPLRLYESLPGTDYVELQAPSTLGASYSLTLPNSDGSLGQVLTTNGSGQLSWTTGMPSDVVLIGGNTVTSTLDLGTNNGYGLRLETDNTARLSIASSGTVTIHEPVIAQDTIRLEDRHSLIFEDDGSRTVGLRAPGSISTSYTLSLPIADGATGEVLTTNGAGQLSWSTAPAPSGAVLLGGNAVTSTMQVGTLTNHDFALFSNGLSRMVIGSEGVYAATVDSGTGLAVIMDNTGKIGTTVSSRRFKSGIAEIGEDSERFMQLRPVRYHLTRDYSERTLYGFVAEELVEVYPELVVLDEQGDPLGVKEYLFSGILVNEVQRLARQVAALTKRITELEAVTAY